jgi:hypothetical protein
LACELVIRQAVVPGSLFSAIMADDSTPYGPRNVRGATGFVLGPPGGCPLARGELVLVLGELVLVLGEVVLVPEEFFVAGRPP